MENNTKIHNPKLDPPKTDRISVKTLDGVDIRDVFLFHKSTKQSAGDYVVFDNTFSIRENKWYNRTQRRGSVGAISLAKHLTSLERNLDEQADSKKAFAIACRNLEDIHTNKQHPQSTTSPEPNSNQMTEPNQKEHNRVDHKLLNKIDLSLVAKHFHGVLGQGMDKFLLYGQEIVLNGDKWYNRTQRRGSIGAIELTKHLLSHKHQINEADMSRQLFVRAVKELGTIYASIKKEQVHTDNETPVSTPPHANQQVEIEQKPETATTVTTNTTEQTEKINPKRDQINWQELAEQLGSIPLNEVMSFLGGTPNEDGQSGKWKSPTGDNIQITGQQWYSWKYNEGGVGAVSLMAFQLAANNNVNTKIPEQKKAMWSLAIKELIKQFGDGDLSRFKDNKTDTVFKQAFICPTAIGAKNSLVQEYLHEKRGLPNWIISKQMNAGLLFAGYPSDWTLPKKFSKSQSSITSDYVWAVFLSANGTAAEMRAVDRTDQFAKLLAKGSDKELGGFVVKAEKSVSEKTIAALEASIDSMSYHAIYPGRTAMSCMGVTFNLACKAAIEAIEHGYNFELAFDNDEAGNNSAVLFQQEMINSIGQLSYDNAVKNGQIKYYDLGIKCLFECLDKGQHFYFDSHDNEDGLAAVDIFKKSLSAHLKTQNRRLSQNEKRLIKMTDLFPPIKKVHNDQIQAIGQDIAKKLLTDNAGHNPYYFCVPRETENDLSQSDKDKINTLISTIKNDIGVEKYAELEANGSIIKDGDQPRIAKDWNEYFLYKMKTSPEFSQRVNQDEVTYQSYDEILKKKKHTKIT